MKLSSLILFKYQGALFRFFRKTSFTVNSDLAFLQLLEKIPLDNLTFPKVPSLFSGYESPSFLCP